MYEVKQNRNSLKAAVIMIVMILSILLVLSGCFLERDQREWDESAISDGWKQKYGTEPSSVTKLNGSSADDMSESHFIMATMILKNNGMNDDLYSYKKVELYNIKTADGQEKLIVVADGNTVYP